MNYLGSIGRTLTATLIVALIFGATSAMAATLTSPSYKIDGNMGGSFGGQTSSTSYTMSAIGGEAIVGSGASGSYLLDQRVTTTSAQTMQLGVQPSGLVGYYPMDENTGTTTADASQYQHNGTLHTNVAATWNTSGKIGGAVNMNGSAAGDWQGTGGVHVADNANLPSGSAMTVEAWLKQDANPTNNSDRAIANHWYVSLIDSAYNSPSWSFGTTANGVLTGSIANSPTDTGGTYISTNTGAFTYGTWQHVVMVYDGSLLPADKVRFYVNGSLVSSTVTGNPVASTLQDSTADFVIGAWPDIHQVMNGSIDQVKLFNRALSPAEITAEYAAQASGISTGLTLGALTSGSTTSMVDAIVRTNATDYNLGVQQDHDLQSGAATIPAISGSIASPLTWSEGVTKGLGFTLTGAPALDGKWNAGAKYAAVPSSATTFYSGTGHVNGAVDVINLRLRLDIAASQPVGAYSNAITYTGTTIP
jgi:hypothetical protein